MSGWHLGFRLEDIEKDEKKLDDSEKAKKKLDDIKNKAYYNTKYTQKSLANALNNDSPKIPKGFTPSKKPGRGSKNSLF